MLNFRVSSKLIECKQILFKIEIEIRFKITESNWIVEEKALEFTDIGFIFDHKETI
jgi:hypothetical protein